MTSCTSPRSAQQPAVRRVGEAAPSRISLGPLELLDGLQQRHEPDPGDAADEVDQPGLAGEHARRRGRRRRRGSSRRCSSRRSAAPGVSSAQRITSNVSAVARALLVERQRVRRERAAAGELPAEHRSALVPVEVGVRLVELAQPVEQLPDGVVVLLRRARGRRAWPGSARWRRRCGPAARARRRPPARPGARAPSRAAAAGRRAARCRRGSRGRAGAARPRRSGARSAAAGRGRR